MRRRLLLVVLAMFVVELAIMLVLPLLHVQSELVAGLIDAVCLSLGGGYALWKLVAEPVRRAADEAVRESADSLRVVVNSVGEVLYRTDREGRFTYLNPAWERITGCSRSSSSSSPSSRPSTAKAPPARWPPGSCSAPGSGSRP